MTAPPWLGATVGSAGLASQVNQFLAAHAVTYVYQGASVAAQTTLNGFTDASNGLWLAQKFTTGAGTTGIGWASLYLAKAGTPAGPLIVSLYADSGGPVGPPLVSTAVPKEFVGSSSGQVYVPLPATVSPSTTYWIVTQAIGDGSDKFTWEKTTQPSGASTSPDGVTWTAQTYGYYFQVFDNTVAAGKLMFTWEDSGARWTELAYNGNGQLSNIAEYTAGQTPNGYTVGNRALTYSSGTIVGVA